MGSAPHPWRASHARLSGLRAHYLPLDGSAPRDPEPAERWLGFLHNHREAIAAVDCFAAEIMDILRRRFPAIKAPPVDDICYATQNRQDALESVARQVELVLVVGSVSGANSNSLVRLAIRQGVRAHLIRSETDISDVWLEDVRRIALTAGASTPEFLIERSFQRKMLS